jgi:hypothetical protein
MARMLAVIRNVVMENITSNRSRMWLEAVWDTATFLDASATLGKRASFPPFSFQEHGRPPNTLLGSRVLSFEHSKINIRATVGVLAYKNLFLALVRS